MQRILLVGNLGKSPEERCTKNGNKMVTFSLAVSPRKDETVWYNCVIWQNKFPLFKGILQALKKGSRILIQGELRTPKTYTAKNGEVKIQLTVEPSFIGFVGGVKPKEDSEKSISQSIQEDSLMDDEEIPF